MANNLIDIIVDTFPASNDIGVPLLATVKLLFSEAMDEDDVDNNFFVEGPDTDQFVGPGLGMLEFPNNISQGEMDDFLRSPGYRGIVQGETTFEHVSLTDPDVTVSGSTPYRTRVIFTPDQPLFPLTEYRALISDVDTVSGITYSGIVSLTFTTGSGSIEEVPTAVSSSVLMSTQLPAALVSSGAFRIVKTTPADNSIEQALDLSQILIEFNKNIDATSITSDMITIESEIATDHPKAAATAIGDLAKTYTVSGVYLTINI